MTENKINFDRQLDVEGFWVGNAAIFPDEVRKHLLLHDKDEISYILLGGSGNGRRRVIMFENEGVYKRRLEE